MQSLIPFLETLIPAHQKELYYSLLDALQEVSPSNSQPPLEIIQSNLSIIRKTLATLKSNILQAPFNSGEDEILFFKITKPHFHSLLIYWIEISELELHRPLGGTKTEEKYLRKHLRKLHWFFSKHAEFYSYYRGGKKFLDAQYFRTQPERNMSSTFSHDLEIDPRYSTEKDWLVAKILGFERMQNYIESEIAGLKETRPVAGTLITKPVQPLQWTASKAGLIELVYALHSAGVYNNGSADIKSIASNFEQVFHVKLGNFYNVFNELRLKKTSRTQLLDTLREKVTKKMDELDEK